MLGARNKQGLTSDEIAYCLRAWEAIQGDECCPLDIAEAHQANSRTRFNENSHAVILGADAIPGTGMAANARLSTLACLCHELAHCERFIAGYNRPTANEGIDYLLDEAETSLRASFHFILSAKDREDLVEDARDRLVVNGLPLLEGETMTPIKIRTTGFVVNGICDVQTPYCIAAESPKPITVVFQEPSGIQCNVCKPCMEEKILSGEWDVPGAKLLPDQKERLVTRRAKKEAISSI